MCAWLMECLRRCQMRRLNLPLFDVSLSGSNYATFNSCAASQLFSNSNGLT